MAIQAKVRDKAMTRTIKTMYIPATGRQKIARIRATGNRRTVVLDWTRGSGHKAHTVAALTLAIKLRWKGRWTRIARPEGGGFVFFQ